MDVLSLLGLLLGIGAILGGNALEGGHLESLVNGPAIVIVFGGTVGATMLQTPLPVFMQSLKMISWVISPPKKAAEETLAKIVQWSNVARREGLLGLEGMAETEADLFARKGLQLLVDGTEPGMIRAILEVDLSIMEDHDVHGAQVFEGMGGYSPTIGIIGAVMGLIHVMQNLSDPSELGSGIATAFVATIYGVGLANLVFLPIANKLKAHAHASSQLREMIMEGLISVAEGDNPRYIETKLQGYLR